MRKTARDLVVFLFACFVVGACGSTVSGRADSSNGGWWRNNLRNHWVVVKRDATDLYRSIDRHFFNYDWDDPYLPD